MSIAIALNLNSGYTDLISDSLKLWPFDAAEEFSAGVRVEKVSQTVHHFCDDVDVEVSWALQCSVNYFSLGSFVAYLLSI